MTYQNNYYENKIWKENTINKWHTKIITMKTKYGKRIPLTHDITHWHTIQKWKAKYGKRIQLTHDIPKLLQWKQNMEREYH